VPDTGQAGGLSDELQPYVDVAEADAFDRMGELLRAQRPTPRDDLLTRVASGPDAQTPAQLRLQIAAALLAGLLLLGLALLGASGSGPLG
jgi:cytochrome P450